MSLNNFLLSLLPLYLMVLIGFFARKVKVLNKHANQVMTQLMLYITLPSLIIFSLNINVTPDLLLDFVWLIFLSIFHLMISIVLARLSVKRSKLSEGQKSVYESLIIFGNQGFLGLALSYTLYGHQGIVFLTLFNICYLLLIWTYGIYLFTRNSYILQGRILILNPGVIATVIGLMILFSPFILPEPISNTLEQVGKMTIPLSMILIGSMVASLPLEKMKIYIKNIYLWKAAFYKLFIVPICLLIFFPFQISFSIFMIAVLTAAMPSASTISLYAQKFSADIEFSAYGIMISYALCIITIPLLYSLLQFLHRFFY